MYNDMHDAGRGVNPALVDGEIRGGFAHGLGAALYEELAYADDGSFVSGTFAGYRVPTACEVPNSSNGCLVRVDESCHRWYVSMRHI